MTDKANAGKNAKETLEGVAGSLKETLQESTKKVNETFDQLSIKSKAL